MFGMNLLRTTFEKISEKKFKPLTRTVVVPRKCQRFFVFKALHVPTIVETAKRLTRLKSWADRQNFPWRHGLDQANAFCVFFLGGLFARINYKF